MDWSADKFLLRMPYVIAALGSLLLAARAFNRFDSAGRPSSWISSKLRRVRVGLPWRKRRDEAANDDPAGDATPAAGPAVHLSRLSDDRGGLTLVTTLRAEARWLAKGLRWRRYAVAGGLIVAALLMPLDSVHRWLLPVAWVWPVLAWSPMGVRESQHHVDQLLFSAGHPLRRQLPATWLVGFTLAIVTASGAWIRFLIDGDSDAVFATLAGALFIPSLALALGTWTISSKVFQIVFLSLWYIGPMQRVVNFDFIGTDPALAMASSVPATFAAVSVALIAASVLGRARRIRT